MKRKVVRKQPRKDSKSKRVNLDNERLDRFEKDLTKTKADNDVSWYSRNAELLKSAASIPFSTTTGELLPWPTNPGNYTAVPGVEALYFIPTLGGYDASAVNAAKESIYSYVVHANSRNTRYGSSDLMMMILAGAQLFAAIASAIRAYGIMRTFDQRNKYTPRVLIEAMGFSYQDLQANLSNMWFDINEMIARSTQIWIPTTMPIVNRWVWMNSNIYMDSESVKGQMYVFVQDMFLGLNETAYETGTSLMWMGNNGNTITTAQSTADAYRNGGDSSKGIPNHTWKQFVTMINGMFDLLLNSEDRGIMMGDILKAYGSENIFALTPIPSDYQITPIYDREVLTQIENASVNINLPFSVTQNVNTNQIVTEWGTITGSGVANSCLEREILNFHQKEVPSPEQVMVATRLKCLGGHPIVDANGKLVQCVPETMGTEFICLVRFFVYTGISSQNVIPSAIFQNLRTYNSAELNQIALDAYTMFLYMTFDWAPWWYISNANAASWGGDASAYVPNEPRLAMGDYDNYTWLDANTFKKMNTTALYSEFGVPVI